MFLCSAAQIQKAISKRIPHEWKTRFSEDDYLDDSELNDFQKSNYAISINNSEGIYVRQPRTVSPTDVENGQSNVNITSSFIPKATAKDNHHSIPIYTSVLNNENTQNQRLVLPQHQIKPMATTQPMQPKRSDEYKPKGDAALICLNAILAYGSIKHKHPSVRSGVLKPNDITDFDTMYDAEIKASSDLHAVHPKDVNVKSSGIVHGQKSTDQNEVYNGLAFLWEYYILRGKINLENLHEPFPNTLVDIKTTIKCDMDAMKQKYSTKKYAYQKYRVHHIWRCHCRFLLNIYDNNIDFTEILVFMKDTHEQTWKYELSMSMYLHIIKELNNKGGQWYNDTTNPENVCKHTIIDNVVIRLQSHMPEDLFLLHGDMLMLNKLIGLGHHKCIIPILRAIQKLDLYEVDETLNHLIAEYLFSLCHIDITNEEIDVIVILLSDIVKISASMTWKIINNPQFHYFYTNVKLNEEAQSFQALMKNTATSIRDSMNEYTSDNAHQIATSIIDCANILNEIQRLV